MRLSLGATDRSVISMKRVVLRGAPFHNKKTVTQLLRLSIPQLSEEEVTNVVRKAEENPAEGATVIVCLEQEAQTYYRNLIENGLETYISN